MWLTFRYCMCIGRQRSFHTASFAWKETMKVLNVAEKNDAAKNIAFFLSEGGMTRREGFSKFNKVYQFQCFLQGQKCDMVMTSVSGHLLNWEFVGAYRNWNGCSPESLFDAPVVKFCPDNYTDIKRTLEREVRSANKLIIWTDCDREGENIGFEIITVCTAIKPNIQIYRAKFSEITSQSIKRALQTLGQPNKLVSDAVDVRSELDLRIGASFTRFQTLRLQKVFPILADYLLSYGSCQFPTLGFVVERYLERERFIPEPFWKIRVTHTIDDLTVEFRWQRDRLFDENVCQALLLKCQENPLAKVEKVDGKPKSKWRPTPLDTTEMEKIASRKLRLSAKETLKIAEKLYTQGLISYPRTETNIFPGTINLSSLVQLQTDDPNWGGFAARVLNDGPNPRQGKKSDQSHPPIHPIKYTNSLQGNEWKVYELVVRHFLACVSKDAKGHETVVSIDINTEKFTASGLMILEKNYLEVYPYESWNSKAIHLYTVGQTFEPTVLEMTSSQTSPPNLLTEADLISLMEKHGIGTDATHAEHIETIKSRMYVGLEDNIHFVPSAVGMGLVEGYNHMGFEMSKPNLRAELEADLKRICEGTRQPSQVLREQIDKYRTLFRKAKEQVNKIDAAIGKYTQSTAVVLNPEDDPLSAQMQTFDRVLPCKNCGMDMVLRRTNDLQKFFLTCVAFPQCKGSVWFPKKVLDAKVSDTSCPKCGPRVKLIDFKFSPGSMAPYYPQNFTGCINGCDTEFIEMLDISHQLQGSSTQTQVVQQSGASRTQTTIQSQGRSETSWNSGFSDRSSNESNSRRNGRNDNGGNRGQKRGRDEMQDGDNTQTPLCLCMEPAKRLTTRREGPNLGRDFFVCSKESEDKCNYYTWADEICDIKCFCNIPAKKLTVRKEGRNQGKQFYACTKQPNEKCQFFLWAEENTQNSGSTNTFASNQSHSTNSGSRGQSNTSFNNRANSQFRGRGNTTGNASVRKCGICSQPGHTRRNCPQNQS